MASPQIEHGFTRIANELMEQFARRDFTKRQAAVLWAVLRETYGYNRKTAPLTVRLLADATGIDAHNVRKAFAELVDARCLVVEGGLIGPQKDHAQWGIDDRLQGVKTTPLDTTIRGQNNPSRGVKTTPRRGQNNPLEGVKTTPLTHLETANDADVQEPKERKTVKDMKDNPLTPKGEVEGLPFGGVPSTSMDDDQTEHVEDTVRPVLSASLVVPPPFTPAAPPSRRATPAPKPKFDYTPEFKAWWDTYPGFRKTAKGDAFASWRRVLAEGVGVDVLVAGVALWRQLHPDWREDKGICAPEVWLNKRRWEWEPPSSVRSSSSGGPEVPAAIASEPWAMAIAPYILADGGVSRGGLGSYCAKLSLPSEDVATCWTIAEVQGIRAAAAWAWGRRSAT